MIKLHRASFLFTAMLTLMLAGCGDGTVHAPIEPRADPFLPQQIHVDSDSLRRDTAVGAPIVSRDPAGLLRVSVPIRSAIDRTLYVDYWITFLDDRGQRISKLGPFKKTLQANTPDMIEINSTSPRAADFQLDLRWAR
jgi:hypothetical protein